MDGDVVVHGVPVSVLLAVGTAMLGAVLGMFKWFAGRMMAELEEKLRRIDDLETRVEQYIADMPIHYQRREDAIREYAALQAKLDRIYELIMEIKRNT